MLSLLFGPIGSVLLRLLNWLFGIDYSAGDDLPPETPKAAAPPVLWLPAVVVGSHRDHCGLVIAILLAVGSLLFSA